MLMHCKSISQTDTSEYILIPVWQLKEAAKELEECDGVRIKYEAQKVILRNLEEIELPERERRELMLIESNEDCQDSLLDVTRIAEESAREANKFKNQRNILGGASLLLLLVLIVI